MTQSSSRRERLNTLYKQWSAHRTDENLNHLLDAARKFTVRVMNDSVHDPDDLAQDVSILIWKKLYEFVPENESSFAKWVSTVIRYERLQRLRNRDNLEFDEMAYSEPSAAANVTEVYPDLSQLPERIRKFGEMTIEGYDNHEIAVALGLSSNLSLNSILNQWRRSNEPK